MRRWGVGGLVLGLITATALSVSGQGPTPAVVQAAFRSAGLSGSGVYADAEVPTWSAAANKFLPGTGGSAGAPADAQYWVGAANGTLTMEQNLGALNTALVINTAGVPSAYTAQACTNQAVTGLSALGAPTCTTITSSYTSGLATTAGTLAQFAATTSAQLFGVISDETGGTGVLVGSISPTLTTPNIGAATATSINGLTVTASTGTLTLTNAKTLAVSNTLTFTGTDSSSVAFGTGGTVAYTANKLSAFAATTSAELATVISDEISAGAAPKLLFGDQALATTSSPTFNVLTVTSCTGCASSGANTALSNLASVAINTALLPSGAAIDLGSSSAPFRTEYLNTDIAFTSTTGTIRANTADASDNATIIIAAGGANGSLRGASLQMYGNEHAQAGDAVIQIGGGTGGQFTVNGTSAWLDIAGSTGLATFIGPVTLGDATGDTITGNGAASFVSTFAVSQSTGSFAMSGTDGTALFTSAASSTAWTLNSTAAAGGILRIQRSGTTKVSIGQSIAGNGADNTVILAANNLYLEGAAVYSATINGDTVAATANVAVDGAGHLQKITSSLRYKQDLTPIALSDAKDLLHGLTTLASVDRFTGRTVTGAFLYRGIGETDSDRWFPGFGAETVAGILSRDGRPIGRDLATYDPDGTPNNVMYDHAVAYIVPVVDDHEQRIQALEAEIAALRATVH